MKADLGDPWFASLTEEQKRPYLDVVAGGSTCIPGLDHPPGKTPEELLAPKDEEEDPEPVTAIDIRQPVPKAGGKKLPKPPSPSEVQGQRPVNPQDDKYKEGKMQVYNAQYILSRVK